MYTYRAGWTVMDMDPFMAHWAVMCGAARVMHELCRGYSGTAPQLMANWSSRLVDSTLMGPAAYERPKRRKS